MNRKLIFALSSFGLIMALSTESLVALRYEALGWMVVFVISAYIISTVCKDKYFLHGLLVGMLNYLWVIPYRFFSHGMYIQAHSNLMIALEEIPMPYRDHPRLLLASIWVVVGIVSGLILGLFSHMASRMVTKTIE
jgi:hypothetical protein